MGKYVTAPTRPVIAEKKGSAHATSVTVATYRDLPGRRARVYSTGVLREGEARERLALGRFCGPSWFEATGPSPVCEVVADPKPGMHMQPLHCAHL